MAVSDTVWHLIIRVRAHGTGMGRRLDYDLSDVIRHTQDGADPLGEWSARRPGEVGLWFAWSPLRGAVGCGVTGNAPEVGGRPLHEMATRPSLTRALLAGVALAMRIDSGEFGEDVDCATTDPRATPDANGSAAPPPSELIDPTTLEIKDGE